MNVGIYLEIKFRFAGFTFGSLRQAFQFNGLALFPVDGSKPDDADKVFDSRGVKLYWWTR